MSRGAKIIKGSIFGSFHLFLNIGISFFMMPFLIRSLGDDHYGLWTLVSTFMGYYGLLDLGLSAAVSRFVARAIGKGDEEEKKIVISTSFYLFLFMGIIAIIITLICIFLAKFIVTGKDDLFLFRIILAIMGFSLSLTFPIRVFSGLLTANLLQYIVKKIDITLTLIKTGLIIYAVHTGYGVIGISAVVAGGSLISGIFLIFFAIKHEKGYSLSLKYFKKDRVRQLLGYSVYIFIGRIADILKYRIDSFIIARFVLIGAVTHYGIGLRLCEYFIELIRAIVGVISPVFSQEEGKGDFDSIREKFLLTTKISTFLSIFSGFMAILYGRVFIERWMGQAYLDSYQILVLLMIPSIFGMSQAPTFRVLYGISKHQIITYVIVAEGVTNLVLSLILVQYYGIFGVALGTAIPQLITTIFIFPPYICKVLNIPFYKYSADVTKNIVVSLLPLLIIWAGLKTFVKADYLNIIFFSFFHGIICILVIILIGFKKHEKKYLLSFVGWK